METTADVILHKAIMENTHNYWTEYHVKCLDCFSAHSSSKENDIDNIDTLCSNGYCNNFTIQSNDRHTRYYFLSLYM